MGNVEFARAVPVLPTSDPDAALIRVGSPSVDNDWSGSVFDPPQMTTAGVRDAAALAAIRAWPTHVRCLL